MGQPISVDPEKIISHYRGQLEAAQHKTVLLEFHIGDLNQKLQELEDKVAGMAAQLATKSTGDTPA